MASVYNNNYFGSAIFDYDYQSVADAIIRVYQPRSVIDIGCGKGELSKALARKGVEVMAVDGYAEPDFSQYPGVVFHKVNLNEAAALSEFAKGLQRKFDVCVSLEVAEHLNPAVSESFAAMLTTLADVLVFSAAVPYQDGDGHINCRNRASWNAFFEARGFFLKDKIRSLLRQAPDTGRWYQLNTLDYTRQEGGLSPEENRQVLLRLLESDSAGASMYYDAQKQVELLQQWMQLDIIRLAFRCRNFFKQLLGKPQLRIPGRNPFPPEYK